MGLGTVTVFDLFVTNNVQVTHGNAQQARSESAIAANPLNPKNLIAASKKFSNPATYRFSIGLRVSFDGGETWQDSVLPTLPEWGDFTPHNGQDVSSGMTDPAVVFDSFGNAFYVGEPIKYVANGGINTVGMFIYKSTDGGATWGHPQPLHVGDLSDDKSWIACDNNPGSPHFGNVYVVWGALAPLRFARSTDHGVTWKGTGASAPGSPIVSSVFAPEVTVGTDGTIHIVWYNDGEGGVTTQSTSIDYTRSTDGGETFEPEREIVSGMKGLRGSLPVINSWPVFPGANFRVITLATGCAFHTVVQSKWFYLEHNCFIVAWSDFREGVARIYFRVSTNSGATFNGPASGRPLVTPGSVPANLHHFHPQLVATGKGVIGCAYYEYGPKGGKNLIDVVLTASRDHSHSFSETVTVTEQPWDPKIDAPFSHGDPKVTFIGEYFGLDADETGFDVLWTDTRTGVQELFFDHVLAEREVRRILRVPDIVAEIVFGVAEDGGGYVIINGHIIKVPPRGPVFEIVQALVAYDVAEKISGQTGLGLRNAAMGAIANLAKSAVKTQKM